MNSGINKSHLQWVTYHGSQASASLGRCLNCGPDRTSYVPGQQLCHFPANPSTPESEQMCLWGCQLWEGRTLFPTSLFTRADAQGWKGSGLSPSIAWVWRFLDWLRSCLSVTHRICGSLDSPHDTLVPADSFFIKMPHSPDSTADTLSLRSSMIIFLAWTCGQHFLGLIPAKVPAMSHNKKDQDRPGFIQLYCYFYAFLLYSSSSVFPSPCFFIPSSVSHY